MDELVDLWCQILDVKTWRLKNTHAPYGVFPKIGVPQNGWFIMENPIKMDDLGVPPFKETPIGCS